MPHYGVRGYTFSDYGDYGQPRGATINRPPRNLLEGSSFDTPVAQVGQSLYPTLSGGGYGDAAPPTGPFGRPGRPVPLGPLEEWPPPVTADLTRNFGAGDRPPVTVATPRPSAGARGGAPGIGVQPGAFLSTQTVTRADALGYDPGVYQQYLNMGMSPADAERAAMTMAARSIEAGFSGVDPRTGLPTLERERFVADQLGRAYLNDQRYRAALSAAAGQRMAAQGREEAAFAGVERNYATQNYGAQGYMTPNQIAAMRTDPEFRRQADIAMVAARGGVTQAQQRATGQLDRQGASFDEMLEYLLGPGYRGRQSSGGGGTGGPSGPGGGGGGGYGGRGSSSRPSAL